MPPPGFIVQEIREIPYEASNLHSSYSMLVKESILGNIDQDTGVNNPPLELHTLALPLLSHNPRKSLIAHGNMGSGKSTCVVLSILNIIDPLIMSPQALLICPTRELAIECLDMIKILGKLTGIRTFSTLPNTYSSLPAGWAHLIVGTSTTIQDLVSSRNIQLTALKLVAFDDVDLLVTKNGVNDSLGIMHTVELSQQTCQVVIFSTTYTEVVQNFVNKLIGRKEHFKLLTREAPPPAVKQFKVKCIDDFSKIDEIRDYILKIGEGLFQTVIFVRNAEMASILHASLIRSGYQACTLAEDMTNQERDKTIKEFKEGDSLVCVTVDVPCGFNPDMVNLIINFDLPGDYANGSEGDDNDPNFDLYMRRVGRLWGQGHKGAVFSLICGEKDENRMLDIERYFNIHVTEVRGRCQDDYLDASEASHLVTTM